MADARISKPTIAWLSFSAEEAARARQLVHALDGEGVIDELGFGPLQSELSNVLYPATNTVMTRCRYLMFVPAIYRWVERRRLKNVREVEGEVRTKFDELRKVLSESNDEGVIGAYKHDKIKRLPSSIYWSALCELNAFRWQQSDASYHQALATEARAGALVDDDGRTMGASGTGPAWDPSFLSIDLGETAGQIPRPLTFHLEPREARLLQTRWRELDLRRARDSGAEPVPSLLSHLSSSAAWNRQATQWPWDVPSLPAHLSELVAHARALSCAARGAILFYHTLILQRRAAKRLSTFDLDLGAMFDDWSRSSRKILQEWNMDEFRRLPSIAHRPRLADAVSFVSVWRQQALSHWTLSSLLDDRAALDLIPNA